MIKNEEFLKEVDDIRCQKQLRSDYGLTDNDLKLKMKIKMEALRDKFYSDPDCSANFRKFPNTMSFRGI